MSVDYATETKPVVYLTRDQANTTFIVDRKLKEVKARSGDGIPLVALAREDRKAIFRNGICKTDDVVVIAFLDQRTDVWRADDRLANVRMQYGADEVSRIAAAMADVLTAEPESEEDDSHANEPS